ncbi:hypothetical protein [Saccharopolyspora elongata]|uniref:hypothetical protein n=1 Tax=Saccharopolyspora elongata TaxID=2530387 RepID=UPI002E265D3A
MRWLIRLRSARFHDNRPVTADDILYSYRRVADPATALPARWQFATVDFSASRAHSRPPCCSPTTSLSPGGSPTRSSSCWTGGTSSGARRAGCRRSRPTPTPGACSRPNPVCRTRPEFRTQRIRRPGCTRAGWERRRTASGCSTTWTCTCRPAGASRSSGAPGRARPPSPAASPG